MRPPVACLPALFLALAVAVAVARAQAQSADPDCRVSCLFCRPEDERNTTCPEVRPEQCRSGQLTRCGCCDTCLVHIADGEFCVGFVPTNGVCNPPMRCEGNECRS